MDQVLTYNRMGAFAPAGMIFALARDVFPDGTGPQPGAFTLANSCANQTCLAGQVKLRPDKRPRPLTLRVNEGCTLTVEFRNLLAGQAINDARNEAPGITLCDDDDDPATARPGICQSEQPVTRNVALHVNGLRPVTVADDGSFVGQNASSLAAAGGGWTTYQWTAGKEGAYTVTSGPNLGGQGGSGAIASGLFGVVNVEPAGSTWYRSQVTREEMVMAADKDGDGILTPGSGTEAEATPAGHPILDYEAEYPVGHRYEGLPILNILDGNEIVHNELNAVIDGDFSTHDKAPYQLYPDRGDPFRELTIIFHDEIKVVQAFPEWYKQLAFTLGSVKDGFAINYGTGGIGSEIIGNRLGVGPMHECVECKYEEFFLTSWAVGDPAMIVDVPANIGLEQCDPALNNCDADATGPKATRAFYPDDPSNVWHGYLNDRTKVRNVHVGTEHHIFHLHAHQWNFINRDEDGDAGRDQSNYLDAQALGPGSSFTYEITYGGAGNRNKTAGDSIFHCHFYPHFAQGMWGLWRVHDTFEIGSTLDVEGRVLQRGLLDAEICVAETCVTDPGTDVEECNLEPVAGPGVEGASCGGYDPDGVALPGGSPTPGVVPIPGKPMPPMPGLMLAALEDTPTDLGECLTPSEGQCSNNRKTCSDDSDCKGNATCEFGHDYCELDPDLSCSGNADCSVLDGVPDSPGTESAKFMGYPFYIPGVIGHRPPTPPLDLVEGGGLPRHVIDGGTGRVTHQTPTDFDAVLTAVEGFELPEEGTLEERVAMAFHGPQTETIGGPVYHNSFYPDGTDALGPEGFEVNGAPPVAGAPYAEPCRSDPYDSGDGKKGTVIGNPRFYAASVIELPDIQLNKVGWHFGQQRILALDGDVGDFMAGIRAPEPFVMRANTHDCVDFNHTNRVPNVYELDDFQVKTPTDVIGQHIHLVKFDVTSADGSGNGWNYEDGTLAKDEITERLHALKATGGSWTGLNGEDKGDLPADATGYRTTRQRWYMDPGWSGNVFTHDHFGPSTHQQAGLYGTVLIEPEGSRWFDPTTGEQFGTRWDGGPTSWRADIYDGNDSYREFYLEFGDFQLAYRSAEGDGAGGVPNFNGPNQAVNPSYRNEVGLPYVLRSKQVPYFASPGCGQLSAGTWTGCAPEAISAADPGTFVVNMRNEPLALRVRDPETNSQSWGTAGDLSHAFSSKVQSRKDPRLNLNPESWPYGIQTATEGAEKGDPFTPTLRVYEGDKVSLRVQVGAHEEGHNFSINGINWIQNWRSGVSGWRNSQIMGISEYFFFEVPAMQDVFASREDFLYKTGTSVDAFWNGSWGLMRSYKGPVQGLRPLPNNPDAEVPMAGVEDLGPCVPATEMRCSKSGKACEVDDDCKRRETCDEADVSYCEGDPALSCSEDQDCVQGVQFVGPCPKAAFDAAREYEVWAVRATDVLPDPDGPGPIEGLVYNDTPGDELWDPTALLYVLAEDIDPVTGVFTDTRRVEPLILRAAAGECIKVNLKNKLLQQAWDDDDALVYSCESANNDYCDLSLLEDPGSCSVSGSSAGSCSVSVSTACCNDSLCVADSCVPGTLAPVYTEEEALEALDDPNLLLVVDAEGTPPNGIHFDQLPDLDGFNTMPMIVDQFNANQVKPSSSVGLHPQLVAYDMSLGDAMNVGLNKKQTVGPGGEKQYVWYAGRLEVDAEAGTRTAIPIEYGAINLSASDPIKGSNKGLIGALVIEPPGSTWDPDGETGTDTLLTRAAVTVTCEAPLCGSLSSGDSFRDFVVIHQDDVNMRCKGCGTGAPGFPADVVPTVSHEEEPEDSGMKGINYRTDPIWHRLGVGATADAGVTRAEDYTAAFEGDPKTPIYTAAVGEDIRLRVLKPGGHNRNNNPVLHGFVWARYPYSNVDGYYGTSDDSQWIDPGNDNTYWHGEQMGHGASNHINMVPLNGCPDVGDFLYRDMVPVHVDNGEWAIVRCEASAAP
jgi:FtsP/CotA-like multicopper oxidase with cupredoxin domain